MMAKLAIVALFLVVSLLVGQFAWLNPASDATNPQRFGEKVNLALRRTGHHLLLASGDSTSRIPAVTKLNDNTYVLQLSKSFDYNQLPVLLQASLSLHKINRNYDVAVLDCKTSELQLGYNFLDYTKNNDVPCGGRLQNQGCYNLKITFTEPQAPSNFPTSGGWLLALGSLLAGVAYFLWQQSKPKKQTALALEETPIEPEGVFSLGSSVFHFSNQTLQIADIHHSLTYREAKLLRLFAQFPNQILERDFILKSVWEDEGIVVSRSVDVFVSRLRKLLQADTALRIVAIHGVGYKLEVNTEI